MAITLTSANVPLPVAPSVAIDIANPAHNPLVSTTFATGVTAGFTQSLNRDNKRQDLLALYGAGGYGIATGLELSAGTGLICNVAAGKALVGGVVELAASTVVVAASQTNWIWLKRDGTLVAQASTTKPSGECVCLGAAVTDGSGVTAIEAAGVVYVSSGQFWRQTADIFAPLDSPGSGLRILTKTLGGEFLWTGSAWMQIVEAGSPQLRNVTLGYAAFATASTTNTINVLSLPPKSVVMSVKARVSTVFGGGSISALVLDFGITGTPAKYLTGLSGLSLGNGSAMTGWAESDSASVQTVAQATAVGGNLNTLTAGQVVLSIAYMVTK